MKTDQLYRKTIEAYGTAAQKDMAVEECSELVNALCKERRRRASMNDVITEIADVTIMAGQLALMYGKEAVEQEIKRKQERLLSRLYEAEAVSREEMLEILEQ